MLKIYSELIKLGIVIFVLLSGVAGYATSFIVEKPFDPIHFIFLIFGLYFLSAGSLALNQAQEWQQDQKMARTSKRPIACGKISPKAGFWIATIHLVAGGLFLYLTSAAAFVFGLLTVAMYNGFYVYIWKKKWAFGAVPGAIPGALPVTIGYVANDPSWYHTDSIYLFLILFLWQIPHFWVLAIKYKDDYAKGDFPVLPVALGNQKTFGQIIVYTILYVLVALAAPWFMHTSWMYLAIIGPFVIFVVQTLIKYIRTDGEKWLGFFLWLNFSMLAFLFVPVIEKWRHLFVAFTS
ncbi:MAG: protoheme farnesyltransferase [Pseudomonadota bacterium]|jgi:protoheme IX farnesyltransferase